MNQYLKAINLSLLSTLLLIKCAHNPKNKILSLPKDNPGIVLKDNSLNSSLIKAFEATATSKIQSQKGTFVVKMFIYYDSMKKIRIENTTTFGNPISSFVSSENQIILHDITSNTLIIGKNKVEHFEKLLQIPLTGEELYSLISLQIPTKFKNDAVYKKNEKFYFINEESRFVHGYFILNEMNLLSHLTLENENNSLIVDYENYKKHAEKFFPRIISIKTKDYFIRINFKKIDFNEKFSDNIFVLKFNKDIKKVYLED